MFTISDFRVLVGNSCGSPCHYRFVTVICLLEHSSGVSAVACLDIMDSATMFLDGSGPDKCIYQFVKERHASLSGQNVLVLEQSGSHFCAT